MSNNESEYPDVKQGTVSPMSQKCADCGAWFRASEYPAPKQALRDHKHSEHGIDGESPQRTVLEDTYDELTAKPSKKDRAKRATKKAGKATATGSKKGFIYLFDERGELLSLAVGFYLGTMWGHAPGQALTLLTAVLGGGAGAAELLRKLPFTDTDRVTTTAQRNVIQFFIGLVLGGVFIVVMHGSINSPVYIPPIEELPDWLFHLFESHNH